ncbi:MAG: hypothetical protein EBR58_04400 [Betaproteobacteria bacterium]|nr:hypothetical protein [Betaproteobacteria bacterium]
MNTMLTTLYSSATATVVRKRRTNSKLSSVPSNPAVTGARAGDAEGFTRFLADNGRSSLSANAIGLQVKAYE